jgi:hypothetical protein
MARPPSSSTCAIAEGCATQSCCDARRIAHDVVALASTIHGRKRGFHVAAELLHRSDRWVHGLHYHDEGAAPDWHDAHTALMTLRRQRAAQLRAELNAMENDDLADDMVARACASGWICG